MCELEYQQIINEFKTKFLLTFSYFARNSQEKKRNVTLSCQQVMPRTQSNVDTLPTAY